MISTSTVGKYRTYPWKAFAGRPFHTWVLVSGVDFDDALGFAAAARVYAKRHSCEVIISAADPTGADRIAFSFTDDKDNERRHYSQFLTSSFLMTQAGAAATPSDAPRSLCVICGAVQDRVAHLMHIEECLVSGKVTPGTLYARHRSDTSTAEGLRAIDQFADITWTKEDGPISSKD